MLSGYPWEAGKESPRGGFCLSQESQDTRLQGLDPYQQADILFPTSV